MRIASNCIWPIILQSKSIMSVFSLMRSSLKISLGSLPLMVGPIGKLAFPLAFKFPDNQFLGCILGLLPRSRYLVETP